RPRTPPATIIIFPFRHDPGFIGHGAILDDLVNACSTRPARLALVGLGGIGKTQLAIELAYRLVKLAKMSVFWVHAESRSSINQSFKQIASNVSPWGQVDSVEAWLRHSSEWLSKERNGRWVMILDGANDHSIFQDELYLPKSRNGTIIVTTRRRDVAYRLTGNKQDVVEIGPLSVFEAVTLLETKLGRAGKERFPKNGAASGLVKSLGLIPLAICRAAAYIQSIPLPSSLSDSSEQLVKLRDSEQEKIKLLEFEDYSPDRSGQVLRSLLGTWRTSFDAIRSQSSSAANLLSLMSFFDRRGIPKRLLRPFRRGHDPQLTDVSPSEDTLDGASGDLDVLLYQDLEILLNHCLITANGTKQLFEMHGLVQLSVKKNLDASHLQTFEQQFIKRLAMVFPKSIYSSWATCEELFAHVQAAANYQPVHRLLEDFANLLHNGGRFARLQGRYEIAMQLAEQALTARQKAETDDTKTLTLITLILMDQGLYDRAEELLMQVVDACKSRNPDINDPQTEISMNSLALIYKAKGRWAEAAGIQIRILLNRASHLGPEYPRYLASKANLASIYRAQGGYTDAERTQKEVVDSYRNKFGPDHHLTLTSLNNLGSIYRLQGKLGEAETLQAQALVSLRMKLGGEHPDTLTCMNSLASTYRLQGRLYEAESLQKEALEMRTIKLGSDHPHTLASMNNLALIYCAQGKHQVAAKLQSEVVEICKTKLGPEHPHTLTSLNNIALIWKSQGRDADGRWKMDECAEARLRVLGQNHPYTISSREAAESWWSSTRYAKFPDIS
ncbi:hypothetical protein M431DRAFT_97621, partial [Trichoderma harzianum CBS 226.95]